MKLPVDDDELVSCVACGLCLPHCPTYRVTGEESASPRGRIAAMRAVHFEGEAPDAAFTEFMDLCVQCRACEAVCPSSVPFGHLMEGARQALVLEARYQPWWRRLGYRLLGHHRLLLALSTMLAVAQRLRLVPARLGLPRLPLRRPRLQPAGTSGAAATGRTTGAAGATDATATDAWLFTGCVMDAWCRPTHAAALALMEATGAAVTLPGPGAACCGALHVHAGLVEEARALARRVMAALPGDAPVVVDSAGCGAALKDYGRLLDTPEAHRFAARVYDVHEWLAARALALPEASEGRRFPVQVAVVDPCHLRHVQRAHQHVRTVLGRYAEVVELDDEGLCCGAGGAYSVQHPDMAGAIRDRKLAAVARSGAAVVAAANPGCMLWLAAAGLDVRHPLDIAAEVAFGKRSDR
jgi:glycolate oxidase iron-sulfur subunit